MPEKTDPKMLRIGKAADELTKTWPVTIFLISLIFPVFSGRFLRLVNAMEEPLSKGAFGTDKEIYE